MAVEKLSRRRVLQAAGVIATSKFLLGCGGDSSPDPEPHEKELLSKNFMIVSHADGYDGAHEINPRVEALDPLTGERVATLTHGSTTVKIAPGGRYVGLLTAEDDSYKGNAGVMPTTLRVIDTRASLHAAILQRSFEPAVDGVQLNRRNVAIDDTGCVALTNFYEDGVTLLVPDGTVRGAEVNKPQSLIAAADDPKPVFVRETGELVIAEARGEGFSLYVCDGETFKPKATITVAEGRCSIIGMDWQGPLGAIGTLDEQEGVYETVLVSRDDSLSPVVLQTRYMPSFSSKGLLATCLTVPGSLEVVRTGLSVIDPHTLNEQRLDGLSDPQWLNASTLLARDTGAGIVHKITVDERGVLGVPQSLSYAIPMQESTVIRGMA